jgi:hypothetical protein
MQYELERAYHQRREASAAARQRLIEDAQGNNAAATAAHLPGLGFAVRVWRRVVSSPPLLSLRSGW